MRVTVTRGRGVTKPNNIEDFIWEWSLVCSLFRQDMGRDPVGTLGKDGDAVDLKVEAQTLEESLGLFDQGYLPEPDHDDLLCHIRPGLEGDVELVEGLIPQLVRPPRRYFLPRVNVPKEPFTYDI